MNDATAANNHLLTDPIPRLLLRLAVPVGIGFFFNTMFNVVDTFYGGLVSTQALAVMSLAFPTFFVVIAVGAGISTGATALIGHALGAGEQEGARRFSVQSLSFGLLHGLFLSLAGPLVTPLLFRWLGAEGDYLSQALSYINVLLAGGVFFILNQVLNASLNASGDTKSFRNFLVAGFFLNLIYDPWFLFGGLGVPPLGLPGIAWATVAVQLCGNIYLLTRVRRTGLLDGFQPSHLLPRRHTYLDLARQGFPASLNMLTVAMGIFVITWFLGRFGKDAVAAYGIAARLEQMALLPVMGLNIATLALVAQNSGAGLTGRVRETIRGALVRGVSAMAVIALLFFLLADRLVQLFTRDPAVIAIGTSYLHVAALVFCAYVILYINVFALQGLKRPQFAIWIGIYRQFLLPLPVFYLFSLHLGWGVRGIWWGIFLVTWSAAVISIVYIRRVMGELPEDAGEGGTA
ncbi:MATE family efflux transporter [Geomobilimonas luticola]|uniref:MATE family efflux transporter n=1 Tax=Geomobilimonas luticola TaxID=1114878 RepID=A0ABS5SEB3_9BACT|nr:MATE family efflux transporter [Geomobilimonas luticola]MBT0653710.1 MATE family efflux transporter [Geomobilimonas luticola]